MQLASARGVVFDLDGTLVDSLDDIMLHLNEALAERGLPPHSRIEVGEWVGYGALELVKQAVPDPLLVPDVFNLYGARYRAQPVVHTRVFAGLASVLTRIAEGRAFAVLSNKPHALTLEVCRALLGAWTFPVIAGQQEGRPKKPDPAALLAVCAELGLAPRECVMIGDSEVDVATARAAGVTSVGVTWGLRPLEVLTAAAPDHLVHTPAELGALFTGP